MHAFCLAQLQHDCKCWRVLVRYDKAAYSHVTHVSSKRPVRRFWSELVAWQKYSINYLAGSLSFLFGIVLWVTTLPLIRRRFFNVSDVRPYRVEN